MRLTFRQRKPTEAPKKANTFFLLNNIMCVFLVFAQSFPSSPGIKSFSSDSDCRLFRGFRSAKQILLKM